VDQADAPAGYGFRESTEPEWSHSKDVGSVGEAVIELNKDDWFFGVRAYDAEGDSARALDLARQAVDQATALQHRGISAWNRWHLAAILARAGDPDAERAFRAALAAAEERGMRPLQGPLPPRPRPALPSRGPP